MNLQFGGKAVYNEKGEYIGWKNDVNDGGFRMCNTDYFDLMACKIRGGTYRDRECSCCKKGIGKGMVVMGKGYYKLCPECAKIMLSNVIRDLESYKQIVIQSKTFFDGLDLNKWNEENRDKLLFEKLNGNK